MSTDSVSRYHFLLEDGLSCNESQLASYIGNKMDKTLPFSQEQSKIPRTSFIDRCNEELDNHPFDQVYIGKSNPYDGTTIYTDEDYYRYLREHTYHLLCEEATVRTVKRIRDEQNNETTSIRLMAEALKSDLSKSKTAYHRLRIVSVILLILLLASIVTVFALLSSGGTYEDGYAAGKTAGHQSGYAAGKKEGYASGQTDGYNTGKNDGFVDGYQEGYSDGESGVLSWWEQFNKTNAMDDTSSRQSVGGNTGATRDEPIADAYIGNKSSKKFHLPTCSYLPDAANQITFDSRDDAIAAGYSPCGHCHP